MKNITKKLWIAGTAALFGGIFCSEANAQTVYYASPAPVVWIEPAGAVYTIPAPVPPPAVIVTEPAPVVFTGWDCFPSRPTVYYSERNWGWRRPCPPPPPRPPHRPEFRPGPGPGHGPEFRPGRGPERGPEHRPGPGGHGPGR